LRQAGAQLLPIQPQVGRPAGWLRDLDAALADFRPEIVHTWTGPANRWGRLAARRRRVPQLIASYRTVERNPLAWDRALERWLSAGTRAAVANSESAEQYALRAGVPAEKLRVIPNAVAANPPCSDEARRRLREELGLPEATRLIGALGPLVPAKRIKDLLWAIDLLHAVREDTYLLVAPRGGGWSDSRGRCMLRNALASWDGAWMLPNCSPASTASGWEAPGKACRTACSKRWRRECPWWPPTHPPRGN
jgi:glycosyltransferase involved in cell wall biosynthesis